MNNTPEITLQSLLQGVVSGEQKASSELIKLLDYHGILNEGMSNFVHSVTVHRNKLMAEHLLRYVEPIYNGVKENVKGCFRQPDGNVITGPIKIGFTELGHAFGFFPREGHILFAGLSQTIPQSFHGQPFQISVCD